LRIEDYSDIQQRIGLVVKEKPIRDVFERLYPDVGVYYALKMRRYMESRVGKSDEWTDIWYRTMVNYGLTEAGMRITWITETSRGLILDIVRDVFAEVNTTGVGISQATDILHRELKKRYGTIERWRAMRIANTEILTASNRGALEGAKSMGVPYRKIWSTSGRNVRDTHQALEGVTVGENETFNVGGTPAVGPGAANLPPEEVINCKCTVLCEPID